MVGDNGKEDEEGELRRRRGEYEERGASHFFGHQKSKIEMTMKLHERCSSRQVDKYITLLSTYCE
eukprot:scaffold22420_cov139-Skeletonema_dohrnii-CCMP3373.AAC.5